MLCPALIRALSSGEWKSSASRNVAPISWASTFPTADLPHPEGPLRTMTLGDGSGGGLPICMSGLSRSHGGKERNAVMIVPAVQQIGQSDEPHGGHRILTNSATGNGRVHHNAAAPMGVKPDDPDERHP